jgi:hypothetical protein
MLFSEFFILILSFLTGILATYLVFRKAYSSPVLEMKIMAISLFMFTLGFLFFIPTTIFNSSASFGETTSTNELGLLYYRIGAVVITMGLLLTFLAFYLPTLNVSYKSLGGLIIVTCIFSTSTVLNFTISQELTGSRLTIIYDPLNSTFLFLSQTIFVGFLIWRVKHLKSLNIHQSPFLSTKAMLIIIILASLTIASIVVPVMFPDSFFPTFTNGFITAILFLAFAYAFNKDENFFFVTPVKFEGMIFSFQSSGLPIFSMNFNSKLPVEELLSSIFTSLNISLKSIFMASTEVKDLAFGDKMLIMESGEYISSFFVVSNKNLIVSRLTNYLTKLFENQYQSNLEHISKTMSIELSVFDDFKDHALLMKKFFPL